MSGFLKFIVHLIVFLSIISVLALAVPPFVGISTVVIDDADKETNLPLGSVTYGKEISGSEVLIGDSIWITACSPSWIPAGPARSRRP